MQNIVPTVKEIQVEQNSDFTVVNSLEEMIKAKVANMENLKKEKKKLREMIQDGLQNDAGYKEDDDRVKNATKVRSATKEMLMKMPSMKQLADKAKSLTAELKEDQVSLSDYLLEFKRLTQVTQLELFDGSTIEIVETAKAVKR